MIGSNPILSVGADSTIAPLFAVALLRMAPASSVQYLELVAATAVVALMALGGGFVALLPEAALAAVVIAALSHALNPKPLIHLWRIDRDQYVALATALAVLVFGVLNGMMIAVAISLAAVLRRLSRPLVATLGQLGESRDFVDTRRHPEARIDKSVGVYRPAAPIFFPNCEKIFAEIERDIALAGGPAKVILSVEESDDFDATALDALVEFDARLTRAGRTLFLARVKDEARELLARTDARHLATPERSFWSVADAFDAARRAD